ncbi:MAG TPA: TadE family protein [Thermomicrobiales bacterium]|nr:TadE family protein [Thermomicrobiales bacterium]
MRTPSGSDRGQTLVELALVLPLFVMALVGIIVLGTGVFYQQQLANAGREAARFAAISSASALCPVVSHLPPVPTTLTADQVENYFACDGPVNNWPKLHAAAQNAVFGMNRSAVHVSACWSGYVDPGGNYDAPAEDPMTGPNTFVPCTMRTAAGTSVNPRTQSESLPCPPEPTQGSALSPPGTDGDDKASDLAASTGDNANQVTIYTCYVWRPPMAGFLLIPDQVTLRAVVTEAMHHQR